MQAHLEEADVEGFVNALNREYLWYRPELMDLLEAHGMSFYMPHVRDHGMYRWYPQEVLDLIIQVNQTFDDNIPLVNASEKCIPAFLLKENNNGM